MASKNLYCDLTSFVLSDTFVSSISLPLALGKYLVVSLHRSYFFVNGHFDDKHSHLADVLVTRFNQHTTFLRARNLNANNWQADFVRSKAGQ